MSCCFEEKEILPLDVIIEILSWLPPDKLLKFMAVSKTWYSTIRDTKFKFGNYIALATIYFSDTEEDELSEESDPLLDFKLGLFQDNHPETVLDNIMEPSKIEKSKYHGIMSTCNGLFCWASPCLDDGPIQLCNPIIRRVILVPPCRFHGDHQMSRHLMIHDSVSYSYGVGFDRVANDYKVVKFIGRDYEYSKRAAFYSVTPTIKKHSHGRAAVYSVNAKCWTTVNDFIPPCEINECSTSFFLNGYIHWLAQRHDKSNYILMFDVCNYVFREMELPEGTDNDMHVSIHMVKDSICLMEFEEQKCHIWMMKEYGVTESWTKLQSSVVSRSPYGINPYGINCLIMPTVGGKFIFCDDDITNYESDHLFLYDPKTNQYTNVAPCSNDYMGYREDNVYSFTATLELLDIQ